MKLKDCIAILFIFTAVMLTAVPVKADFFIIKPEMSPSTAAKGQPTDIKIQTFTDQGSPLNHAHVTVPTGGGAFLDSFSTAVKGFTDAEGSFKILWQSSQCDRTNKFRISVEKAGFITLKGQTQVNIEAP